MLPSIPTVLNHVVPNKPQHPCVASRHTQRYQNKNVPTRVHLHWSNVNHKEQ